MSHQEPTIPKQTGTIYRTKAGEYILIGEQGQFISESKDAIGCIYTATRNNVELVPAGSLLGQSLIIIYLESLL